MVELEKLVAFDKAAAGVCGSDDNYDYLTYVRNPPPKLSLRFFPPPFVCGTWNCYGSTKRVFAELSSDCLKKRNPSAVISFNMFSSCWLVICDIV